MIGAKNCQTKLLPTSGEVTSPNFPENYPDNVKTIQTIEVAEGMVVSLEFSVFDVRNCWHCLCDHLSITDGDGTILLERNCGGYYKVIKSRSNTVNILFISGNSDNDSPGNSNGVEWSWSANWTAVPAV